MFLPVWAFLLIPTQSADISTGRVGPVLTKHRAWYKYMFLGKTLPQTQVYQLSIL